MNLVTVAVAAFAALLPITNPLGALAAFAGLTAQHERRQARAEAIRTGIYVAAILAVFAVLGAAILRAFGITLSALQIAGGLVVCHSGFSMLNPKPALSQDEQAHTATKQDVSFSPMALPLVAGPGAIGVVIALASRNQGLAATIGLVVGCLAIGLLVAVLLAVGAPLVERLGPTGVGALSRIMGFLILAIGVELLVHGLQAAALFR